MQSRGWLAQLDLEFVRRMGRTVLARNQHRGPLQVQKALYPEGDEVCHIAVLHPPGGIAAGDELSIRAGLTETSMALLTTPGATKWYRSEGLIATQQIRFCVAAAAVLEWLPRENILFDGSKVCMTVDVDLAPQARYFGWDILCFGRRASGETWRQGTLQMRTRVTQAGSLLWSEVAHLDAGSGFAAAVAGLAGFSVCGTFIMAGGDPDTALATACREVPAPQNSRVGVTRVPGLLIARYLGDSTEDAFGWFTQIWQVLRPAVTGKQAQPPRVWTC